MARPDSLDQRRIRVGIQTANGTMKYYEDPLNIYINGESSINQLLLNCEIQISNLAAEDRDYILTTTSPYNLGVDRKYVPVTVDIGRQSTGLRNVYLGQVYASSVSLPPDVTITLNCKSGFLGTSGVIALAGNDFITVEALSKQILTELNRARDQSQQLSLDFKALLPGKKVANTYYTGPATSAINIIRQAGFDAYIEGSTFIIRDQGKSRNTTDIPLISAETGMIGIPEITEVGVNVKFLLDIPVRMGDAIKIDSKLYKVASGIYQIYKLRYEAATRDVPFYYIAECRRDYFRYGISTQS